MRRRIEEDDDHDDGGGVGNAERKKAFVLLRGVFQVKTLAKPSRRSGVPVNVTRALLCTKHVS